MPGKIHSRAQAALIGAVAGGEKTKATGLTQAKAKEMLRHEKVKGLPKRKSSHHEPDHLIAEAKRHARP